MQLQWTHQHMQRKISSDLVPAGYPSESLSFAARVWKPRQIKAGEWAMLAHWTFNTEGFREAAIQFDNLSRCVFILWWSSSEDGIETNDFLEKYHLSEMVRLVKNFGQVQAGQCPAKAQSIGDQFYDACHHFEIIMDRSIGNHTRLCIVV